MRSWAFATSPYGLGLTTDQNWNYTPREFKALSDVYEQKLMRWALERSMFANAHFRGKDTVAFVPEDFLGTGNREAREREERRSMMMAMQANTELMKMKKGAPPPEDLPDWAR